MSTRAFKKQPYGGKQSNRAEIAPFYTYVTQLPFRGHDPWVINDASNDKQKALEDVKAFVTETDTLRPTVDRLDGSAAYNSPSKQQDFSKVYRHPAITDDMIKKNPFVFALNQAKLKDSARATGEVNVRAGFDYFNRRREFPYDLVENPMRIDPQAAE